MRAGDAGPGQTASVCLAFQAAKEREGRASNGFCRTRGPSRQAGARTASPPACICSRGGSPGQTASVRPCVSAGRERARGRASNGFCRTRGPSAKRGGSYGLAPPLAYARGGASGSDGKFVLSTRFQLARSGKGRASNGFCRTRGPSAKRGGSYGLAPPLAGCSPGGVRVRRQVLVLAFQLEAVSTKLRRQASGPAEPVTFVLAPGEPSAKRGARTGLAPRLQDARGGAVPVRAASALSSRFSWKEQGKAAAEQRFLSYPGTFRQAGGLVRPRPRLHMLAGAVRVRAASVCLRDSALEGARAGPGRQRFFSYPGTFRQAGGLVRPRPPRLPSARGGAVRVRRQVFVLAFRLEGAGRPCQATVFVVPGDLPPSGARYGRAPPLASRSRGDRPGQTASSPLTPTSSSHETGKERGQARAGKTVSAVPGDHSDPAAPLVGLGPPQLTRSQRSEQSPGQHGKRT
jgi:hypothetical protein